MTFKRWMAAPAVAVALGAAGLACARGGTSPARAPAASPPSPLLGFVPAGGRWALARIDPRTLRPSGGARVDAGTEGCASRFGGSMCWTPAPWSFSPDRRRLAIARNDGGVVQSLRLVDPSRPRVAADIALTGGSVGVIAWPAPDRIVAVQEVCCEEREQLLVIDPAHRRLLARRSLEGTVLRAGRTPRELVLLLAPSRAVGPARLAVVDADGAVRFRTLDRVRAGERLVDRTRYTGEQSVPGLAIDPAGGRGYVVGDGLVADVDLTSLAVTYRTPARPVSLLGRLRDAIDPPALAKEVSGPTRTAYWLGDGRIAVAGSDADRTRVRPSGLSLLDTRDWSVRTVDRRASGVRVAGDLLLADTEDGVVAYGLDGKRRFRLPGGRSTWVEQVYDGRAYVSSVRPDALRVIDLATGRAAAEPPRTLPNLLLRPASSAWDAP